MNTATPPVRVIKARRSVIENIRRNLKTAPLTAWFGMIVILLYAICAIFAPLIAPMGNPKSLARPTSFQPGKLAGNRPDRRDTLSRWIFGACATQSALLSSPLSCLFIGGRWCACRPEARLSLTRHFTRRDVPCHPVLIFALMMLAVVGKASSTPSLLALLDATRVFRLSRAVALNSVVMDYVESASCAAKVWAGLFSGKSCPTSAAAHRVWPAFLFRVSHHFRALIPWCRHSTAHRRLGFNGG
jgi:peptide/nickel transport system permease protein